MPYSQSQRIDENAAWVPPRSRSAIATSDCRRQRVAAGYLWALSLARIHAVLAPICPPCLAESRNIALIVGAAGGPRGSLA